MSRDPRYSTSAWQRTRKAILRRDGYQCLIGAPGCLGQASTVHHLVPTSQGGPFYASDNLVAACSRCNYSHGGRLAKGGRPRRDPTGEIAALKELVQSQWAMIAELEAQLEALRPVPPPAEEPIAAIY